MPHAPEDSPSTAPAENWDLETVYDTQISPLMEQIIAICKTHHLPLIASFEYRRQDDDESFVTTGITYPGRTSPRIDVALEILRYGLAGFALKRGAGITIRPTD